MRYYLFLDDERFPADVTWVQLPLVRYEIVRSYDEFVRTVLTFGIPEFVTFDHDLADEHYTAMLEGRSDYGTEKTGYDCAKWLVEFCADRELKFPQYEIHSMNPIGADNIRGYIESAKRFNFV